MVTAPMVSTNRQDRKTDAASPGNIVATSNQLTRKLGPAGRLRTVKERPAGLLRVRVPPEEAIEVAINGESTPGTVADRARSTAWRATTGLNTDFERTVASSCRVLWFPLMRRPIIFRSHHDLTRSIGVSGCRRCCAPVGKASLTPWSGTARLSPPCWPPRARRRGHDDAAVTGPLTIAPAAGYISTCAAVRASNRMPADAALQRRIPSSTTWSTSNPTCCGTQGPRPPAGGANANGRLRHLFDRVGDEVVRSRAGFARVGRRETGSAAVPAGARAVACRGSDHRACWRSVSRRRRRLAHGEVPAASARARIATVARRVVTLRVRRRGRPR